jgi:hypothetical protein
MIKYLSKLNVVVLAILFFCVFVLAESSEAASYHVRAGATGNGADWANALPQLPAALTRGDTYYVAEGSYGSYTFDDANSGSSLITIKKATQSDHGSDAGWNSAYGDGVAIFSAWTFSSGYYYVDGQTGGGPSSWDSGFGFKVVNTKGKRVVFNQNINNITIRHTEITNNDSTANDVDYGSLVYAYGNVTNVTFSYCKIHHVFGCDIQNGYSGSDYWVIEYSKVGDVTGTSTKHSEIWSTVGNDNWVWRYNWLYQWRSTGALICINGPVGGTGDANFCEDWLIYGNVFDQDGSTTSKVIASYADNTDATYSRRWKIYNNTFINLASTANWVYPVSLVTSGEASNEFKNNVLYGNVQGLILGGVTEDYNSYSGVGNYFTGTHDVQLSSNPFTGYGSKDYRLNAALAGVTLPAAYAMDMFSITRGSDGTWDRGAFESGGTIIVKPAPPSNLVIN